MHIKSSLNIYTSVFLSLFLFAFHQQVKAEEQPTQLSQHSQQEGKERQHHMKRTFKKMAKYLALSPDQRLKFKALFQQEKQALKIHKSNLRHYKEQVEVLIDAAIFDEQASRELHEEYQESFTEIALFKIKNKHAMHQILTKEQREKFARYQGEKRRGGLLAR
ncbi:Spy/CpxP family protein refolding chaperone [Colwelliaceae bacterium 6441]